MEGNALLTVEPGVTIMFTGTDGTIVVEENAGLRMVGTAENPITLTGPTNNPNPGAWNSVEVTSNRNDNQFEYVNFINGGSGDQVLYVSGKLSVKHCNINYSASVGAVLGYDGVFTAFENNSLQHISGYPLVLNAHEKVNCLGTGNTYNTTPNYSQTFNMIMIDDYWLDEDNVTATFTNQGIPYYLRDGINVYDTAVMKVNAGAELVFAYDKEMVVGENALIQVDGTSTQPVVFRGFENESGYWNGMIVYTQRQTNGGSHLTYCQVLNGGEDSDEAALTTFEETRVALNNVSISGSNGYGLRISIPVNWDTEQYDFANYHVTASGLSFANCAQGNIYETNKEQVYSSWPGSKKRK